VGYDLKLIIKCTTLQLLTKLIRNLLKISSAIVPDIGVVLLKSRRRVGVVLIDGVAGLDLDAWGWVPGRSCGGSLGQPFDMPRARVGFCSLEVLLH
jgi:hypothetical protein